jgi:hypothetical protein
VVRIAVLTVSLSEKINMKISKVNFDGKASAVEFSPSIFDSFLTVFAMALLPVDMHYPLDSNSYDSYMLKRKSCGTKHSSPKKCSV